MADLKRKEWKECRKCDLCKERNQVVLGEGNHSSPVMLVGINPGKNEDQTGRPFIGAAGKFLEEGLKHIGIGRGDLWITNTVKCKTPFNVAPSWEQVRACSPILQEEIQTVNPLVIVPVGAFPLQVITGSNLNITRIAGNLLPKTPEQVLGLGYVDFPEETLIFPIIHPAGVLRNMPLYRDRFFRDLDTLVKILEEEEIL